MFSRVRKYFNPAAVVAVLAVLLTTTGGAYAANRYLITSTKQIKPSVLKALRGNAGTAGKNGASGANGAQGPQGPQGAAGNAGANGTTGTNGTPGTNGESVTATPIPTTSAKCEHEGGGEYKVGGGTAIDVCNGKTGFTKTLPEGDTETGTFSGRFGEATEGYISVPISFAIPLEGPLAERHVHYVTEAEQTSKSVAACQGSVEEPSAEVGNLCIYQGLTVPGEGTISFSEAEAPNGGQGAERTAGKTGTVVVFKYEGAASSERTEIMGSWAVTG